MLGLQGTWSDFAVAFVSGVVGTLLLAIGTEQFFLRKNHTYETVLAIAGGIMAYCPGITLKIAGVAVFALLCVLHRIRRGMTEEVGYAR